MTEEKGRRTFECPACRKSVCYFPKIRLVTMVEQVVKDSGGDASHGWTRRFNCPCCDVILNVRFELKLAEVRQVEEADVPVPTDNLEAPFFTAAEKRLIEVCRENRILEVFADAVCAETYVKDFPPRQMERFLVRFFRRAVQSRLEKPLLEELILEFPGQIEFWKADRIGMVVSDRRICRFVPMRAMNTQKIRRKTLVLEGVEIDKSVQNWDWLRRTKYGYVPESGRIFLEILLHSLGDRRREMRDIPLRSKK